MIEAPKRKPDLCESGHDNPPAERPYRDPLTFDEALEILNAIKEHGEVDGDILSLFASGGLYESYRRETTDS